MKTHVFKAILYLSILLLLQAAPVFAGSDFIGDWTLEQTVDSSEGYANLGDFFKGELKIEEGGRAEFKLGGETLEGIWDEDSGEIYLELYSTSYLHDMKLAFKLVDGKLVPIPGGSDYTWQFTFIRGFKDFKMPPGFEGFNMEGKIADFEGEWILHSIQTMGLEIPVSMFAGDMGDGVSLPFTLIIHNGVLTELAGYELPDGIPFILSDGVLVAQHPVTQIMVFFLANQDTMMYFFPRVSTEIFGLMKRVK